MKNTRRLLLQPNQDGNLKPILPYNTRDFKTPNYGMKAFADLFTPRQLVALTTFSDLVGKARELIKQDALAAGVSDDGLSLNEVGKGATAYADAVATYLAFGLNKGSDYWNNICTWHINRETIGHLFTKQAIPMAWDFAEANPLSNSTGNYNSAINWVAKVIEDSACNVQGTAKRLDATVTGQLCKPDRLSRQIRLITTILAMQICPDFFYIWLRRSLGSIYPDLFSTLLVPKFKN